MKRLALAMILATGACAAQGGKPADPLPTVTTTGFHKLRLTYADGVAVEIFTQSSTNPLPAARTKQGPDWPGAVGTLVVWRDGVHRIVIDKDSSMVFGYDIAASPGRWPGTVSIRITPLGGGFEAALRSGAIEVSTQRGPPAKIPAGPIPTVAGARDFPSIAKDQALTMDILYNPSTGEKIFEVIIPSVSKTSEGK